MSGLLSDIRFGFRMLVRTPLLSLVAVLTIGLGVGGTTFAYSSTLQLMNRGLPVQDPHRLMAVQRRDPSSGGPGQTMPFHDYRDIRDRQTVFRDLAAGYTGTVNLSGEAGPPERFQGGFITANAFDGLGVPPLMGRGFQEGDDLPGARALLLLGFDVWTNRFAADANIVGKTARVNGETATIIGVMPEGFGFPIFEEMWVPLRFDAATVPRGGGVGVIVWGYLNEGASASTATAELQRIAGDLEAEYPELNEGITVHALPYVKGMSPPQVDQITLLMLAMAGGVLLVACANVANLLLARATMREREIAIRSALGADRNRVIRQLLAEAIALGAAGGVVGLGFAHLGLRWITGMAASIQVPYWSVYRLDTGALLFTILVTLTAAVLAGTVPAVRASGTSAGLILRDESRGSSSLRMGRFSTGLVVAELAISCGLMIGAGLVVEALLRMTRQDLGYDVDPVVTARIGLFEQDYPDAEARNRLYHQLLERLRAEAEATEAALTTHLPGTGGQARLRLRVEGATYPREADVPTAGSAAVSPGLFATFGIPTLEGRDFLLSETERGGEPVAIVNRSFADRYLGGGSALGRRIRVGLDDTADEPWMRIVGVVADTNPGAGRLGLGGEMLREIVYRPLALGDVRFMSAAVRARGTHADAIAAMRRAASEADPNLPLYWVQPMQAAIDEAMFLQRIFGLLSSVFGAAALFLAVVGLYGVIDFSVSSRLREMGVRLAMGASGRDVMGIVLGRVLAQLGVGLAIGLALGFAMGQPLSTLLVGVRSWDPLVYAVIVLVLGLTTVGAALPPALKALRVDPVMALRAE